MTTVQLRRYDVEPGRLADFLAWFPGLAPVRAQYGFRLLFGYADDANSTFTWAVEHDGDEAEFSQVEAAYNASPERAAVFETFPACITATQVGFVRPVL
ncbi:MAG: hypothetical protein JWR62_1127 [Modestobacter sp.]|nr:hypothetical protein [Modestobacter sp.]